MWPWPTNQGDTSLSSPPCPSRWTPSWPPSGCARQRRASGRCAGQVGRSSVTAVHIGMGPPATRDALRGSRRGEGAPIDHVMIAGICGGLDPDVPVGTLINPEVVVDHSSGSSYRHTPPGDEPLSGQARHHREWPRSISSSVDASSKRGASRWTWRRRRSPRCARRPARPWSAYRCIGDRIFDGLLDERVLAMTNPDGSGNPEEMRRYWPRTRAGRASSRSWLTTRPCRPIGRRGGRAGLPGTRRRRTVTVFDDLEAEEDRLEAILDGLDTSRGDIHPRRRGGRWQTSCCTWPRARRRWWRAPAPMVTDLRGGSRGTAALDETHGRHGGGRARRAGQGVRTMARRPGATPSKCYGKPTPSSRIAWATNPLSPATLATTRLAEHWAHALDITERLGIRLAETARLRHIAWLGHRTLPYAFSLAGMTPVEMRCDLAGPERRAVGVRAGVGGSLGSRGRRATSAGWAPSAWRPRRHASGERSGRERPPCGCCATTPCEARDGDSGVAAALPPTRRPRRGRGGFATRLRSHGRPGLRAAL